jgi:hypothetical protein
MIKKILPSLLTVIIFATSPALRADEGKDESGKGKERESYRHRPHERQHDRGNTYFHRDGYTHLDIPAGHYPPPGECRIWYPDRPAGHQPPPGKCSSRVPAGAWLIRHPANNPDHVHVVVYEPNRPGVVQVVGEFNIGTGVFVRVVLNP